MFLDYGKCSSMVLEVEMESGWVFCSFLQKNENFFISHRLQFACSNNVVEYEALVHGFLFAEKRKFKVFKVFRDTKLFIDQVSSRFATKNKLLKDYKHIVWDLLEIFYFINL